MVKDFRTPNAVQNRRYSRISPVLSHECRPFDLTLVFLLLPLSRHFRHRVGYSPVNLFCMFGTAKETVIPDHSIRGTALTTCHDATPSGGCQSVGAAVNPSIAQSSP